MSDKSDKTIAKTVREAAANTAWRIIEDSTRSTPDWIELKSSFKDEFLVFVTGHMRQEHWNENFLQGCNYYGLGTTWDNRFVMKRPLEMSDKPKDPLVFHFPEGQDFSSMKQFFDEKDLKGIEGEVYGVPLRKLAQLDKKEFNGDGTNRVKTWVSLRHGLQEQKDVQCYMYVIDLDFFLEYHTYDKDIGPCNTLSFQNKIGQGSSYYYYTPRSFSQRVRSQYI